MGRCCPAQPTPASRQYQYPVSGTEQGRRELEKGWRKAGRIGGGEESQQDSDIPAPGEVEQIEIMPAVRATQ